MTITKKDDTTTAPLILAVDSTAKVASAAITRGSQLLSVATSDTGHTHSETLLPMIESMMKGLHLDVGDINLFACATGPGSFTGVRIGVAIIKGLAFGKETPCASVSPLEALAQNLVGLEGIFCPAMDARRDQIYNALFRCQDGNLMRLTPDRAIAISDLAKELELFDGTPVFRQKDIYLSGDAYHLLTNSLPSHGITPAHTPELLRRQSAYSVALCGYAALQRGETVSAEALAPVYLRLPQAERERLERQSLTNQ